MTEQHTKESVLVIKHGALGDFILSTGPFKSIRRHHKKEHIILLTTKPFVALAEKSGFFDEVWVDERPKIWKLKTLFGLLRKIRQKKFSMVYDLQTSTRSSMYFRLLGRKKPNWSGIVPWCSHPHTNPHRVYMHTIDRQEEQLHIAGIERVAKPDVSWLKEDISELKPEGKYALIVAGGSAHRKEKRWHDQGFADLANWLHAHKITPVLLGTDKEKWWIFDIMAQCDHAIDLTNKTEFGHVAELARHAELAVGNDTGPMHIIAATGCPSVVLFSGISDPYKCAPVGKHVHVIQEARLKDLEVEDVISVLKPIAGLDTEKKLTKPAKGLKKAS